MNTFLALFLIVAAICALVAFAASRPRGRQLTPLCNDINAGIHEGDLQVTLEVAVGTRHLLLRKGAAAQSALIGTVANRPLGFAEDEGAIGDKIAFYPLGSGRRTVLGVSAGAIVSGATVTAAADGKVATLPAGAGTYWVVGEAWGAAAGADEEVEIIPCTPYQVTVA